MPYEKQTWTNGDLMTASKLNHIEEGLEALSNAGSSGPGCLIVDATTSEGGGGGDTPTPKGTKSSPVVSTVTITLNKTAREIIAAFPLVYMRTVSGGGDVTVLPLGTLLQRYVDMFFITHTYHYDSEDGFSIPFQTMGDTYSFNANSLDDYPVAHINPSN